MLLSRAVWLSSFVSLAFAQAGIIAVDVPFNTDGSGHGPDGPWNYITMNIGAGPSSAVDFYPMWGAGGSFLVTSDACKANPTACIATQPNYYNAQSQSGLNSGQDINITKYSFQTSEQLQQSGTAHRWVDNIDTSHIGNINGSDISFQVMGDAIEQRGTKSFVPLSLLSLEKKASTSEIKLNKGGSAVQKTLEEQYTNSTGGSSTVSFHMGSATFKQAGSLVLGGYDQSRLIEDPAYFDHGGDFPISSISFGTASGASPWSGSLANPPDNFLSHSMNASLSPHLANLLFPPELCTLFSTHLPVHLDTETNLYLWNTSDPAYRDIISSPSYLNITFASKPPISIKVAFALLNLTLTAPLKSTPTPYFPCSPTLGRYGLGRAFLQAAIIMTDYPDGHDWTFNIGQAPGPSVSRSDMSLVTLPSKVPQITKAAQPPAWEDTWSGILQPLKAVTASAPGDTSGASGQDAASSGLSGGAVAGVVIGVLAALAGLAGVLFLALRRRRQPRKMADVGPPSERMNTSHESDKSNKLSAMSSLHSFPDQNDPGFGMRPVFANHQIHEMAPLEPQELPDLEYLIELPDNRKQRI